MAGCRGMLENFAPDLAAPNGDLNLAVSGLRLGAAALFGGAIGLERESHRKPAGLRTHILIALAAALFTLLAFDMIAATSPSESHIRTDPLRLIQALTAGLAVLGAGAIIHSGGAVHGLTTGASLWMVGVIGMACGAGRIGLALLATALALLVLLAMRSIDAVIDRRRGGNEPPD